MTSSHSLLESCVILQFLKCKSKLNIQHTETFSRKVQPTSFDNTQDLLYIIPMHLVTFRQGSESPPKSIPF